MVEQQPYRVIRKLGGGAELRHYPPHRVVSVDVRGGFSEAGKSRVWPLGGLYLWGKHRIAENRDDCAGVCWNPTRAASRR